MSLVGFCNHRQGRAVIAPQIRLLWPFGLGRRDAHRDASVNVAELRESEEIFGVLSGIEPGPNTWRDQSTGSQRCFAVASSEVGVTGRATCDRPAQHDLQVRISRSGKQLIHSVSMPQPEPGCDQIFDIRCSTGDDTPCNWLAGLPPGLSLWYG